MSNIKKVTGSPSFDSLDAALEHEMALAASKPKTKKRTWEVTVEQSKLPDGVTRFRILPRDGSHIPWVSFLEHEIFNKTDKATARKGTRFVCPSEGSTSGECRACSSFLPRLMNAMEGGQPMKGAQEMAKSGRASARHAVNVVFEQWGGGPVPEDLQGVRIFKYKQGVHKGNDRVEVRGILALLSEHKEQLTNVDDGVTVEIAKSGKGMDTTYTVSVVTEMAEVQVGAKKQKMKVAVTKPLPNASEHMANRHDLESLAKKATPDEVDMYIEDVSPIPMTIQARALPGNSGTDRFRSKKLPGSTLQDTIDADDSAVGSDDDIPF